MPTMLKLYKHFKLNEIDKAIDDINSDLERLAQWSEANSLVLNPIKSKFIALGSRKQVSEIKKCLSQNWNSKQKIVMVETVNGLGLTLESDLRFEKYINGLKYCIPFENILMLKSGKD